jgi:hypothetical protein
MEKLRQAAFLSIGRAVGFAGFGIFVTMVGLSFDPVLALRSGGVLILLVLAGLLLRAQRPLVNFRHTEAWLLLDRSDRPDERHAAQLLSSALREAYIWFARWTAAIAVLVWVGALLLGAARVGAAAGA